jgi:hypothetical protein
VKISIGLPALALLLTGCIALPPGLHVTVGGDANYYDAPTRTIALAPDQPMAIWAHEACHARQHEKILERDPASDNLWLYFQTPEGVSFLSASSQVPSGAVLEDEAWVCAWYYVDPSRLTSGGLAWAQEWLR